MNQGGTQSIALDQRLARAAVRRIQHLPITPNAVTLFSVFVGIGAACLIGQGGSSVHWGAALFMVAAWLDHWDGELARLTGRTSEFGHYFDYFAALINYCALFIGIGFGVRETWVGSWAIPLGIVAGIAVTAIFAIRFWIEQRDGRDATRQAVRGGFEVEDALYLVGPVTWLGGLAPFLVAAGIGAPIFLLWVAYDAFVRKPATKHASNTR